MGKQTIRCTVCGAKNKMVDHCRICATLLPGADKRRREGIGGRSFAVAVEEEQAAWQDYKHGRMSAAARSRRPDALPDAPPATWGLERAVAAASGSPLGDDGEELPPHAQFGPPGGAVIIRESAPRGASLRGALMVLVALVIAVAIGFGAYALLVA